MIQKTILIRVIVQPKLNCCHHLLTLMLFQTCWVSFFCWTQKMIFQKMLVRQLRKVWH